MIWMFIAVYVYMEVLSYYIKQLHSNQIIQRCFCPSLITGVVKVDTIILVSKIYMWLKPYCLGAFVNCCKKAANR